LTRLGRHQTTPHGLRCDQCDAEPPSEQTAMRPRPMRCPSCRGSHCERCHGLGYLRPSFYPK
jgi:hypothetical protein